MAETENQTTEPAAPSIDEQVMQAREQSAEAVAQMDEDAAVKRVRELGNLPPALTDLAVYGHMVGLSEKDPAFRSAWDNRHADPAAVERELQRVAHELAAVSGDMPRPAAKTRPPGPDGKVPTDAELLAMDEPTRRRYIAHARALTEGGIPTPAPHRPAQAERKSNAEAMSASPAEWETYKRALSHG